MKIVVIGAGAGGMAAATRAKRVNSTAQVIVLEAGEEFSRGTCSLPYYLSGELPDQKLLWGATREGLESDGIQLVLNTRALKLDPARRTVETDRDTYRYDRLIVSTGSQPRCIRALGATPTEPRVWQLRTVADVMKIHCELRTKQIRKVAVVGAGYVGLESTEAFCRLGLDVTLFHQNSTLVRLSSTLNNRLVKLFQDRGVDVRLDTRVEQIQSSDGLLTFRDFAGPGQERFDAFCLCHGIEPKTQLLTDAGARPGRTGAVMVSARGETGLPNIYACGDGVELPNPNGGAGRWIPLATTAARLGRVCGENAAGGSLRLRSNLGALTVRLFDVELGLVGLPSDWNDDVSEAFSFEWGIEGHPFPARQAGLGVLYTDKRTGRLKGLQAVGPDASRLVDVASLSVEQELCLDDLQNFDYAYNPPISALWHPFYLASRAARKEAHVGGYRH